MDLDPKSLEFGQEISVFESENGWLESIGDFVGYDPESSYPWKVRGIEAGWRLAQRPKPKRPDLKPGDVVTARHGDKAIFIAWDEDTGKAIVTKTSMPSQITTQDGVTWPPRGGVDATRYPISDI